VSHPGHAVKCFWWEQYFYSTNGRTLAKLSLLSQPIEPATWKSKLQCARLHGSVRTSEQLYYSSKRNL